MRKQVAKVFNPVLGTGLLTYINDHGTYCLDAACTVGPYPLEKMGNLQLFSVELTAHNPYFYPEVDNELSVTDETVSITNSGDVPAPITVHFTGAGIITLPSGEKIEVTDTAIVSTHYGSKIVMNNNGDIDYSLMTVDSSFISFPVGTFNLDVSGTVEIYWKPLYVGV